MWDTSERPKAAVACDSCTAASPRLSSLRLWLSTDIGVRDASRSPDPTGDLRRCFSATDGRLDFYFVRAFGVFGTQ